MPKSFSDLPMIVQDAIFALIPVLLAGAVFYVYVLPLQAKRDHLQKQVSSLKAENQRNKALERQRSEIRKRIAQLETQLEELRAIVPEEQATDEFMRTVFEDGRASEVHIRTFVPQPLAPKDLYTEMPFNLRIDGTYFGLLSFFNRLANEKRIISVFDLALGSPEGGGMGAFKLHEGETVGANCVLTTYFHQLPPAAPAPPPR
jgi:type IV pilus assembly protein PilO